MSVQELLDIACRYNTSMSDAMLRACLDWSIRESEPLTFERAVEPKEPTVIRVSEEDWERLSLENADTVCQ